MTQLKELEDRGGIEVVVEQCTVCVSVTVELVSPMYTQLIIYKYKDDLSDTPLGFPSMPVV